MKRLFFLLIFSVLVNITWAQNYSLNQQRAAKFVLNNIKIKSTAVRYMTDVCPPNDTLLLACSVKLNGNGMVDDVKINSGLDYMIDEAVRTTLFLMPKGVCEAPVGEEDAYVQLLFNVVIDQIRDIEIARDIELFYRTKKFAKVDLNNEDFKRLNPKLGELYLSNEALNSSLWVVRGRAVNLRIFSPMVKND